MRMIQIGMIVPKQEAIFTVQNMYSALLLAGDAAIENNCESFRLPQG